MYIHNVRDFYLDSEITVCLLLNELHGLYCIILEYRSSTWSRKIEKKLFGRKKWYSRKPLFKDANYDLENNDSRNVLVNGRLELYDFFVNYVLHCSMYSRPSSIASMTFAIFIVFFETVLQHRTMRESFNKVFGNFYFWGFTLDKANGVAWWCKTNDFPHSKKLS